MVNDRPRRAMPIPTPPAPRVVVHAAPPVVQRHAAAPAARIHHAPPPAAWPHQPIQAKAAATAAPPRPGPPPPAFAARPAAVQMWGKPLVFTAPPKAKAQIAAMRKKLMLKPPGQAQTIALPMLWSWVKDKASLSYGAVDDTEQEFDAVRADLSLVLGDGAEVIVGQSRRKLFDNDIDVVSAVTEEFRDMARVMAQQWDVFDNAFSGNVAAARANHTTIQAYLTARGFGPKAQNGNTRVKDLGGGYHATFSIFPNEDIGEEVSDADRLYRAGNMHITREKFGQDHPKNPRFYYTAGFHWESGWAAAMEDEERIRSELWQASETVKTWCKTLLDELEKTKK